MTRFATTVLAAAAATGVLTSCGEDSGSDQQTSVVAAFYPYAWLADRVAGDRASVTNLTAAGAEPHDLELSPQQVAAVIDADVVVYQRGFQPAVDDAVAQNTEGSVLEVTDVPGTEEAGAENTEDPHLWLDPTELAPVADAVADRLAEADPASAERYRANARSVTDDLTALDEEFASTLAECERRSFVTSHAAFGYLARRYDLQMVSIAGTSPDAEPAPARLAELQDLVERRGITTIFTETLAESSTAETLAAETDSEVAVLDPIEGLSDETADEDYLSLMRANLTALERANGCR